MPFDQLFLFALFAIVFAFLVWGRFRYDIVAFAALIVAVIIGVVPRENAFDGFGHPATIVVAVVLVISRGLVNSGAVGWILRTLVDTGRSLSTHVAVMASLGAALSAFMNNVAALALLMPVEVSASRKAGRSPRKALMPLSFATILGGMVTMIGTPPNIIIAAYREQALGESFAMFDFAPVGLACAIAGVAFVAFIGWRLIPQGSGDAPSHELRDLHGYVAELHVPETSAAVGKLVGELDEAAEEAGVTVLGVVRNGRRLPGGARRHELGPDDILVVDAVVESLDEFVGALKLDFPGRDHIEEAGASDMSLIEVVVPRDARAQGRSTGSMGLNRRFNVALLGISRKGRRFRQQVRKLPIEAGDVLLLVGPAERLEAAAVWLGAMPLADRGLGVTQHGRAATATAIFAGAVILAAFNLVYLPIALAAVVALYVITDIVPLRQLYEEIEWPVVILLGSMIPLGAALESSGGTGAIATGIVDLAAGLPPWVVLTILMVVVMTLSDLLNNTATAVIGAPIAVDLAGHLNANPDPFLMTVAVAASCAFLTPIGHKNNTLILGPGGYSFGDYWRMGLPLEIIIVVVSVPTILFVWPL
ncbi:MAG: SLC13 family permease [Alphaproteobacteria bacterium]